MGDIAMSVARIGRTIEGILFFMMIAAALGGAVFLGAFSQEAQIDEALVWVEWVQIITWKNQAVAWQVLLGPSAFIIPTCFISLVALALWAGWLRKWQSRAWAWAVVVLTNLVLFSVYFGMVVNEFGDGPAPI